MEVVTEEKISAGEEKFERIRRKAGFFLAPLGFALTWWWTSGFLSPEASKLSGVLALMVLFWITESIPLPITALLGAVLNIVLGVASPKTVLAPFADPIIFLFIGGFMLSRAMLSHGLDKRIALAVLSIPGVSKSPSRILLALGLVITPISMWVSNTATVAIFLPIVLGILGSIMGDLSLRKQTYATGMMLMLAYGTSISGITTPVASPPNLIAIGQLEKLAKIEIGFLTWMLICVPIFAAMFLALWIYLCHTHPAGREVTQRSGDLTAYLNKQRRSLGKWSRGEISTAVAFGVAVLLWLWPGFASLFLGNSDPRVRFLNEHFPESIVGLLAACLLFFDPERRSPSASPNQIRRSPGQPGRYRRFASIGQS